MRPTTTPINGHSDYVGQPRLPASPRGPSALEVRAARRRSFLAVRDGVPCAEHRADKGEPCSCLEGHESVCALRVGSWRRAAAIRADQVGRLAEQYSDGAR